MAEQDLGLEVSQGIAYIRKQTNTLYQSRAIAAGYAAAK